jgi:hypothetical protein
MNRTTLGNLSVSLLVLVMLTGCAFISKFGLDKELAKADEARKAAGLAQAERYANVQFKAAQRSYDTAKGMIENKQYKEAKLKLAEAATTFDGAKAKAPAARNIFEAKVGEIKQSIGEIEGLVETARAQGASEVAGPQLTTTMQALGNVYNQLVSATSAPILETNNLIAVASAVAEASVEVAKLIDTTLATKVAAVAADMKIVWDNLGKSGAMSLSVDEYSALEEVKKKLDDLLAVAGNSEFLAAYPDFKKKTVELMNRSYQGQVGKAMALAEKAIERAREQGGEDLAPEPFGMAAQYIAAAIESRDSSDFTNALDSARKAAEKAEEAVSLISTEATKLMTANKDLMKQAHQVESPRHQSDLFKTAEKAHTSAQQANSAGDLGNTLRSARKANDQLIRAINLTKQNRVTSILDGLQKRIEQLVKMGAADLAVDDLDKIENNFNDISNYDILAQFNTILTSEQKLTQALDQLDGKLSRIAKQSYDSAVASVEKTKQISDGKYAPDMYEIAVASLENARSAMAAKEYNKAVTASQRSVKESEQALRAAMLAKSVEKIAVAELELPEATIAGSKIFASALFQEAEKQLAMAREMVEAGSGDTALAAAEKAVEGFASARVFKLSQAEAAKISARAAQAPSLQKEKYQLADSTFEQAQKAMQEKRYANANELADLAVFQFSESERDSWEQRSRKQESKIDEEIAYLRDNLAIKYAAKQFKEAFNAHADMKAYLSAEIFENAYKSGQKCMEACGQARIALAAALQESAQREEARLARLSKIVRDEEGVEILSRLRPSEGHALALRNSPLYSDAFNAYETLASELDQATEQLVARNRVVIHTKHSAAVQKWRDMGTEPLAVKTFKSLDEQLAMILDGPNTLDDYDRIVRLDQQFGSELDGIEETIRISMEQMLTETRENLSNVVSSELRGGRVFPEHYQAAAEAYRQAVNYPKGRNYAEVSEIVVKAHSMSVLLLDVVRLYKEEEDYKTAVRDLIEQTNSLLKKFNYIIEIGPEGWRAAQSSARADIFAGVQRIISASEFYIISLKLEQDTRKLTPPDSLNSLHRLTLTSFEELSMMGELFQKYGDYSYGTQARKRFVTAAFKHYHQREILLLEVNELLLQGSRIEEAFRREGEKVWIQKVEYKLDKMGDRTKKIERRIYEWIWGYDL